MSSEPAIDLPDADAQCAQLAELIRPRLQEDTVLVGIHSGGAWVARRLRELLGLHAEIGLIDVSFYRDDYGARGLRARVRPSSIPFDVEGRPLILVDDVLYTGRTTRAAINELFDYGRPASIQLAVLADRGRRQLPICADFCPWRVDLDPSQELVLSADANGRLQWSLAANA
ncbi:MAG TPA: bifunctional pyr operon transcriptional regulator/uracil phosphoribosyltransferase PyrR [Accumulibacter sp.]|uniref:bifunctional pyr operon transcriptional regulator/uracil phosphoribosyltransferase PyrR n=1 Tax=Accumulibacter sp. TaxID=2053492 RepID=UPI0025D6B036|nr:bifunctional pyr operon transcriptional regulator/uracil phosphoribosyltransferase PyrR [Accumulibacter sp.]MCM8599731.1 bifunctional pyr operon transcriptional regulator/uracil phosphoribosyltransferase PyrR [Accumulibacter sp.]MCM8664414.1 bifunctional pyr operon transcriptional regulator/uracil phosphoribosyltransferase PyrR [Accumulibacter sp.]HNC51631.1 bifunctional pyr operon transcriptional regulator/uracil phosphoribosyltransferase PyrR [Accumulibacter sp.]